jgi:hypothetical protein
MGNLVSLIGKKFSRWEVLSYAGKNSHKHIMWLCRCNCGNEKAVSGNFLRSKYSKSCGCLNKELISEKTLNTGEANFNTLYRNYKFGAKKRQLEFKLSKTQFKKLTQENCHYCGTSPSQRLSNLRSNGPYIYNGIDRINNEIGYIDFNCVACCGICNKKKGNSSYADFIAWLKLIVEYQGEKI